MQKFKTRWQIQTNWQLIFPLFGIIALGYTAYKLANLFLENFSVIAIIGVAALFFLLLLKFILFLFKKLENKWKVTYRWEMIRIFIVFAITGSSSVFVGRPIMKLIGITKENLNIFVYWILFILIGLVFYQVLLVSIGWLLGQHQFFWEFEKKMLKRFRLIK